MFAEELWFTETPLRINFYRARQCSIATRSQTDDLGSGNFRLFDSTLSHSFDGDGFIRFREEYRYVEQWIGEEGEFNEETTTTYNLWSTVLGAMIAELDEAGDQKTGFVYAGSRIARLDITPSGSSVKFEFSNPQTQTSYETDHAGKGGRSSEYDPLGAEVPKLDPYFNQQRLYTDLKAPGKLFTGGSDPFRYDSNCQLDGMPISCSLRQQLINNGSVTLKIGEGPTAERIPIDSYGMGIYRVDYKYWVDHGPPARRPKLKFPNGRNEPPIDTVVINTNQKNDGHWEYASISLALEFSTQGLQDPAKDEIKPEDLLKQGKEEITKRIQERESCADVFGGKEKALKALGQLKFTFGTLDRGIMGIQNDKVTVDRNRFKASGESVPLALNIQKSTTQGHPTTSYTPMWLTLEGKVFAAFAVAHELGHKRKIYGEYDDDGDSLAFLESGANNEKIRAACFDELKPQMLRDR